MALIHCSECGEQVSSKAESCPNCGVDIAGKPRGCFATVGRGLLLFLIVSAVLGNVLFDKKPAPATSAALSPSVAEQTDEETTNRNSKAQARPADEVNERDSLIKACIVEGEYSEQCSTAERGARAFLEQCKGRGLCGVGVYGALAQTTEMALHIHTDIWERLTDSQRDTLKRTLVMAGMVGKQVPETLVGTSELFGTEYPTVSAPTYQRALIKVRHMSRAAVYLQPRLTADGKLLLDKSEPDFDLGL